MYASITQNYCPPWSLSTHDEADVLAGIEILAEHDAVVVIDEEGNRRQDFVHLSDLESPAELVAVLSAEM